MEDNDSIDNNSNKLNYKNFYDNYSNQDNKTDSQENIKHNPIKDTNIIKVESIDEKDDYNKKLFGLNKIDYFYKFSNEIKEDENIGIPQDIEIIKEKDDSEDFINDSFEDSFLSMGSSSNFENIFKPFIKIKKQKIFKNTYFRFPYRKEEISTIYCIPEIRIQTNNFIFIYDNNNICLNIEQILEFIIKKELFINKNKNKDILNQAYVCQKHKEKYIGYCSCENNICKQCIKNGCNKEEDIKEDKKKDIPDNLRKFKRLLIIYIFRCNNKIVSCKNQIKNIIKDLSYENNSKLFQEVFNIKLNILFTKMKKKIISYIYFSIIKTMVIEILDIPKQNLNEKYNYNIIKNVIYCNKYLKKRKRKKRKKDFEILSRINYLIPFYSGENINNYKKIYI